MKSRSVVLSVLIACLLFNACGRDQPSGPESDPPKENVASKQIGSDGGELTSEDGNFTLTIPAGALGGTENITIGKITEEELGSEFDELIEAFGFENAYELGPDGLQFQQPITASFTSQQTPLQENDSLGVFAEFLFTSNGETVEPLDSLRVVTDPESNTATLSGQLSHFSPLFEPVQVSNGVFFSVRGVPETLEVGEEFEAEGVIATTSEGALGGLTTLVGPARYLDGTKKPLSPLYDGAPNVEIPLDDGAPDQAGNRYKAQFGYTCIEDGPGLFFTELEIGVQFDLDSGPITATSFSFFAKPVECVAAPEMFSLNIEKEGSGNGIVTSDPSGIDFGDDSSEDYEEGTQITLTATPDEGSEFVEWSGDIEDNSPQDSIITLIMDQARSVTATFDQQDTSSVGCVNPLGLEPDQLLGLRYFFGGSSLLPGFINVECVGSMIRVTETQNEDLDIDITCDPESGDCGGNNQINGIQQACASKITFGNLRYRIECEDPEGIFSVVDFLIGTAPTEQQIIDGGKEILYQYGKTIGQLGDRPGCQSTFTEDFNVSFFSLNQELTAYASPEPDADYLLFDGPYTEDNDGLWTATGELPFGSGTTVRSIKGVWSLQDDGKIGFQGELQIDFLDSEGTLQCRYFGGVTITNRR